MKSKRVPKSLNMNEFIKNSKIPIIYHIQEKNCVGMSEESKEADFFIYCKN